MVDFFLCVVTIVLADKDDQLFAITLAYTSKYTHLYLVLHILFSVSYVYLCVFLSN